MDNLSEAKISMCRSTRDILTGPAAGPIIQAAPMIGVARQDLADIIALIEQLDIERATAAKGDGDNKKGLRQLALASAWTIDGQITAYAFRQKDASLLQQFNHEKTDYAKASDEAFRTMCAATLAKAKALLQANPAGLSDTGLTQTAATILETRLAAWLAVVNKPEDLAKHESAVVALIAQQFDLADELLDMVLDKLMRQFAETQPQFYADYQKARTIYDAATRSQKKPESANNAPAAAAK